MYEKECEENALVRFPELVKILDNLQRSFENELDRLRSEIQTLKQPKE